MPEKVCPGSANGRGGRADGPQAPVAGCGTVGGEPISRPVAHRPEMGRSLGGGNVYEVDDRDTVVELDDAPAPDVGAPIPHLICDDYQVLLAYLVGEPDPDWDGTYVTVVGPESEGRLVAIVRFDCPYAHMFGPPNDEAFKGHPLAGRGLAPYAVFEVRDSSWVRRLARMNSVHECHDRERFLANSRHFVFAFHESTFECIARGFTSEVVRGSLRSVLPRMLAALEDEDD